MTQISRSRELSGVAQYVVVNTSSNSITANAAYTFQSPVTLSANLIIESATLLANGSAGSEGDILHFSESGIYWATPAPTQSNAAIRVYQSFTAVDGQTEFEVNGGFTNNQIDVFYNGVHLSNSEFVGNGSSIILTDGAQLNSTIEVVGYKDIDLVTVNGAVLWVGAGDGLTGGTITSTGTISALANTGIIVNSGGIYVNAAYINTISSNNTNFVGSVSAANVVSNAQLSANLSNYQTLEGLASNVALLTANNSDNLGGIAAAFYIQNTDSRTLSGNLVFSGTTAEFTGNVTFSGGIIANNSLGTEGYILHSNGSSIYWGTDDQGVTSVATGNGLIGGTITSTGTISVLANTGILVSAAGVQLDTNYVETLSVNSALFANSATFLSGNTVTTNSIALSISSLGINSNGIISNTFQVGTSTYFVSNGNVGIDTNAPISSLHVSSNKAGSTSDWYDPANYAATIHHNINGTSRYGLLVSNRWRNSENFVFAVDGRFTNGGGTVAEDTHTPYFIVRGDGNVGIGTASPASVLQVAGSITPTVSNTHDLGTSSLRWRNIYTNDLHLNNGIGDYTIVEGEDDLFLYNNKKNKVYKFVLLEVDANVAPSKMDN